MRLLLDESIPVGLRDYLTGHQVSTVVQMGWDGSTNGSLLALAATVERALAALVPRSLVVVK